MPPAPDGFTACILTYGPHAELASRCLRSILRSADWSLLTGLRVGLNAPDGRNRKVVQELLQEAGRFLDPRHILAYMPTHNVGKYPLMRRMLYGPGPSVTTPYVMWFDDDSYLDNVSRSWWGLVQQRMQEADLLGEIWRIRPRRQQLEAIRLQPWYNPRQPWSKGHHFRFATGGWWCARFAMLQCWNYPFPELQHNGGDSILGELCRQQGYRLRDFRNQGVRVNQEPRRGLTTPWIWEHFQPGVIPDLSHQNFHCRVYQLHEVRDSLD